jgi:hypothetical protein
MEKEMGNGEGGRRGVMESKEGEGSVPFRM